MDSVFIILDFSNLRFYWNSRYPGWVYVPETSWVLFRMFKFWRMSKKDVANAKKRQPTRCGRMRMPRNRSSCVLQNAKISVYQQFLQAGKNLMASNDLLYWNHFPIYGLRQSIIGSSPVVYSQLNRRFPDVSFREEGFLDLFAALGTWKHTGREADRALGAFDVSDVVFSFFPMWIEASTVFLFMCLYFSNSCFTSRRAPGMGAEPQVRSV